jgi:hypothetical protein
MGDRAYLAGNELDAIFHWTFGELVITKGGSGSLRRDFRGLFESQAKILSTFSVLDRIDRAITSHFRSRKDMWRLVWLLDRISSRFCSANAQFAKQFEDADAQIVTASVVRADLTKSNPTESAALRMRNRKCANNSMAFQILIVLTPINLDP